LEEDVALPDGLINKVLIHVEVDSLIGRPQVIMHKNNQLLNMFDLHELIIVFSNEILIPSDKLVEGVFLNVLKQNRSQLSPFYFLEPL
jgi:hypothetical protein